MNRFLNVLSLKNLVYWGYYPLHSQIHHHCLSSPSYHYAAGLRVQGSCYLPTITKNVNENSLTFFCSMLVFTFLLLHTLSLAFFQALSSQLQGYSCLHVKKKVSKMNQ